MSPEWCSVFDDLGVPVLVLSATGEIVHLNQAWTVLAGLSREAAVGQPMGALLPGWSVVASCEPGDPADRRRATWQSGADRRSAEFVVTLSHGCELWAGNAGATATTVRKDLPTAPILQDRRIFAALVENSSDFIGIATPDGTPVYLNPAGRQMIGLGTRDIAGTTIPEYYPDDQQELVANVIVPAMLRDGQWRGDTAFRRFDTGEAIPVSDEHFVITDPQTKEVLGLGTITRDMTELRRAQREAEQSNERLRAANDEITRLYQQAQALDRAKTEFFSNVSHELRTPLTLLLGPLERTLGRSGLPPELEGDLQLAHRNALRLLRLVNTVLELARVEAGGTQARFVPTDLAAFTRSLVTVFEAAFATAGLTLRVDCPTTPDHAWVDRERWEKIVMNLLSNALKYTQEGSVTVSLRQDHGQFVLRVSDTGNGIAATELPRVFKRFFRAAGTNGRSHEGTGIGLALSRELARLHGGDIEVTSVFGRGTTFTVTIPTGRAHLGAAATDQDAGQAVPSQSAQYVDEAMGWVRGAADVVQAQAPAGAPVVVVADDNADLRSYVAGLLAPHYRVVQVADGEEALRAIAEQRPALLLCDVMMPNLDGFGVLASLRSQPATQTLPVILLSARAGSESSVEGLEAGADDYIAKPFTAAELLARVRALLAMAELRDRATGELQRANRVLEEARRTAEAAAAAKSTFLASMSHEIRTPMNGVMGMLDLLRETNLDNRQRDFVDLAHRSADGLMVVINDVLDFSRIEAGRVELEHQPFDLCVLAEDVAAMLAVRAREKQLDLIVDYDVRLPRSLLGDAARLRQVLTNLLANAVKFTAAGHVILRVESADAAQDVVRDPVALRISVRDTGIGIPAEQHQAIFDRFTQVDASTTRRFGGTGLGLAIAKGLIERMGGRIGVDSVEGDGTTFWVELCFARATDGGAVPAFSRDAEILAGARVLVVDDNEVNREVLHSMLAAWGLRNGSYGDSDSALMALRDAAAQGDPYAVAVVDYDMPGTDGELLGRIIKGDPMLRGTSLVMLTSVDRRGDLTAVKRAGFSACLLKPVRQSALFDTLLTVLSTRTSQPAAIYAPPIKQSDSNGERPAVLVVEDHAVNRIIASAVLTRLGCDVHEAVDGKECMQQVATRNFSPIFMDIQMPELDGFAATKQIRSLPGAASTVPIIAMTAHAMQGDRERCLQAGMDDYLSKPLRRADVEAVIRRWILAPSKAS